MVACLDCQLAVTIALDLDNFIIFLTWLQFIKVTFCDIAADVVWISRLSVVLLLLFLKLSDVNLVHELRVVGQVVVFVHCCL